MEAVQELLLINELRTELGGKMRIKEYSKKIIE